MRCHFCGGVPTGQCTNCGRFYCNDHGDGLCHPCVRRRRAKIVAGLISLLAAIISYPVWFAISTTWSSSMFDIAICGYLSCYGIPSIVTGVVVYGLVFAMTYGATSG